MGKKIQLLGTPLKTHFFGAFLKWRYPNSWMVYNGKSIPKWMDLEVAPFQESSSGAATLFETSHWAAPRWKRPVSPQISWGLLMNFWSQRALQEAEPLLGPHQEMVRPTGPRWVYLLANGTCELYNQYCIILYNIVILLYIIWLFSNYCKHMHLGIVSVLKQCS